MVFPWYLFGVLFVLPFVDPRRPFRLLHLDLLALLAIGVGPLYAYLTFGQPSGSLGLIVLGLTYLAGRLVYTGWRPPERDQPLVPLLSLAWLLVLLALVVGFRFGYVLADREEVRDVGLVSVLGADRIGKGTDLYDARLDRELPHPDTYGPANYLLYVPFEQALPWDGAPPGTPGYGEGPVAGRVAAIGFDLLVLGGLFLLGRRLRAGPEGKLLGVALAYAWASYPYSVFVLRFSFNDTLVALMVLAAVLAMPSAAPRGALAALAAATKFGPAILAPILAAGTGERRLRPWLVFGASFAVVTVALFLPFVPDGGLAEVYDRTLGYQQGRDGWNTIWARFPELGGLQVVAQIGVVGLAFLLAVVPRHRTLLQAVALAAGVLVAMQLSMTYWFSAYALWFAPLAFAALFAPYAAKGAQAARMRG
ncbi:MAG: hypothetical protein ACR2KP_05415 [Egibacteraceae bacterium]